MVLTTGATCLGVIVLRIHHHGSRGIPVPPYLRRLGQWMAVMTFSKYPPVERQLSNLTNGGFGLVLQLLMYVVQKIILFQRICTQKNRLLLQHKRRITFFQG